MGHFGVPIWMEVHYFQNTSTVLKFSKLTAVCRIRKMFFIRFRIEITKKCKYLCRVRTHDLQITSRYVNKLRKVTRQIGCLIKDT